MKIFKELKELNGILVNSVSVGTFDGVHSGHKAIVKKLIKLQPSLIITFNPHPREILFSEATTRERLTTTEEKIELFKELGVKNLLILNFSNSLASLSADKFIKIAFLNHIKPCRIILGYNHRFGKDGRGNFEYLKNAVKNHKIEVIRVPRIIINKVPVSSSIIREKISKGDISEANVLLGREYSITSTVISGYKIGRKLNYPTANLTIPGNKLLPKSGVYGVWVEYNRLKSPGMISIGEHPTFKKPFGVEVHIIDWLDKKEDLLNKELKVNFIKYIRENRKFNTPEELKIQLDRDKEIIKVILGK